MLTAQELWKGQRDALVDLTAFLDEHAPGTSRALPVLHWSIGLSRTVYARIHALDREHGGGHRDPRAVITAYSDALGMRVAEHEDRGDKTLLVVEGRTGPPESPGGAARTGVVIRAEVPRVSKTGGCAFVP